MYWSFSETSVFHNIHKIWACDPDLRKNHIYFKGHCRFALSRGLAILLPEGQIKTNIILEGFALSFGISRFINRILNH